MQTLRRTRHWLAGIVLLMAGPCACTGAVARTPGWVSNGRAPDAYPAGRYMIGVGSGSDSRSAAGNARGEIARTFRAHIEQEIADLQHSTSSSSSGSRAPTVVKEAGHQDIEARTRIKTNVMLQGVQIAERWQDPTTRLYWALAVLDRDQERGRLQAVYESESGRLRTELAAIDRAVEPEHRLAATRRAHAAALALDEAGSGLFMLGTRPSGLDASLPTAGALQLRLAELRKQLPIRIESAQIDLASGAVVGGLEPLRKALAEAVTELGFPISERENGSSHAWLNVRSQLGVAPQPELSSEFFVYRWEGGFELSRTTAAGAEVLAVVTEHGRITHSLDEPARRLARREGQKALAESLKRWLLEMSSKSD